MQNYFFIGLQKSVSTAVKKPPYTKKYEID